MKNAETYTWFVGKSKTWDMNFPIVASTYSGGWNFHKDGLPANPIRQSWFNRHRMERLCTSLSFGAAMSYINPEGRKEICKFLDIECKIKKVKITKKLIKEYVQLLIDNHAFNGDTAFDTKGKDWHIFNALKERKIILESPLDNSMYYLNKDWEKNLENPTKLEKKKREKTLRPWKIWEVPIGAKIAFKGQGNAFATITHVEDGIIFDDAIIYNQYSPLEAFNRMVYSMDGHNWNPCGVYES